MPLIRVYLSGLPLQNRLYFQNFRKDTSRFNDQLLQLLTFLLFWNNKRHDYGTIISLSYNNILICSKEQCMHFRSFDSMTGYELHLYAGGASLSVCEARTTSGGSQIS